MLKLTIERANLKVIKVITKPTSKCFDIYLADTNKEKFGSYVFIDDDAG